MKVKMIYPVRFNLTKVLINFLSAFLFLIFAISCDQKKEEEHSNIAYTCSMDPQVMEKKPGKCPICKMELTKTVISADQNEEGIKLSSTQMKLGNIITQQVKSTSIGEELVLRGTLVPDERKIYAVSSRVPGRIEKLYFKKSGEKVHEGDRIYDIYSEELQTAIRQYLLLKDKSHELKSENINYAQMLKAAKDKLLIWGMSDKQISKLTNESSSAFIPFYSKVSGVIDEVMLSEGDYVGEGSIVLKVADYSTLWVEAEAYPSDMKVLRKGYKVNVVVEIYPHEVIAGEISFENPELNSQSRINLVRIEISNKDGKYKPGMRVTVSAQLKEKQSIAIPEEAVLYQPDMNTVWVAKDSGLFVPKMVETGITGNGKTEIKSGLTEGERVVVSGAYLIDSEYRLRAGTGEMPGMNHGKDDVGQSVHQY